MATAADTGAPATTAVLAAPVPAAARLPLRPPAATAATYHATGGGCATGGGRAATYRATGGGRAARDDRTAAARPCAGRDRTAAAQRRARPRS